MGGTALMEAVKKGHTDIVKQLLTAGAATDLQNNQGDTALMGAASRGYTNIVEQLLAAGAATDLQNNKGYTLMEAAQGHKKIKRMLKQQAQEAKEYQVAYGLDAHQFNAWKIPAVQGLFAFSISTQYFPKELCFIMAAYLLPKNLEEDKALFTKKAAQLFNKMPLEIEKTSLVIDLRELQNSSLFSFFKSTKSQEIFQRAKTEGELIALLSEKIASTKSPQKKAILSTHLFMIQSSTTSVENPSSGSLEPTKNRKKK